MTASTPDKPARPSRTPVGVALGGLAVFAGVRGIGSILETTSMAAIVAQAVVAEWGAGWLGVRWSAPDERRIARLIARGLLTGAVAGGLVVVFLLGTRAVSLVRTPMAPSTLAVGLLSAGLYAMRDELLLRGIPLMALASGAWRGSELSKVLVCGLLAGAAAFGEQAVTGPAVMVELILGLGCASLWVRSGGAWWPWAAHTAWLFTTALFLQGGVFEARTAANAWGGGAAGPLSGLAAAIAVLPLATAAIAWAALATGSMRRVR